MSTDAVDKDKRRLLTLAATVVGAVGAGFVAVPFLESWMPSERAKNAGAPVTVNISKITDGQLVTVEWHSKPVWVVRRSKVTLSNLPKIDPNLRDPHSDEVTQQPPYAKNDWRSRKPETSVMVGICTHLGCSPTYRPDIAPADLGDDWLGGFFCPCHSSKYDMAGRVYKDVPAPLNLVVPPHYYVTADTILIGEDGGAA